MIESAACNTVGSARDWQQKADVSTSIIEEKKRSKRLETPYD
jgi:hypothetical protein